MIELPKPLPKPEPLNFPEDDEIWDKHIEDDSIKPESDSQSYLEKPEAASQLDKHDDRVTSNSPYSSLPTPAYPEKPSTPHTPSPYPPGPYPPTIPPTEPEAPTTPYYSSATPQSTPPPVWEREPNLETFEKPTLPPEPPKPTNSNSTIKNLLEHPSKRAKRAAGASLKTFILVNITTALLAFVGIWHYGKYEETSSISQTLQVGLTIQIVSAIILAAALWKAKTNTENNDSRLTYMLSTTVVLLLIWAGVIILAGVGLTLLIFLDKLKYTGLYINYTLLFAAAPVSLLVATMWARTFSKFRKTQKLTRPGLDPEKILNISGPKTTQLKISRVADIATILLLLPLIIFTALAGIAVANRSFSLNQNTFFSKNYLNLAQQGLTISILVTLAGVALIVVAGRKLKQTNNLQSFHKAAGIGISYLFLIALFAGLSSANLIENLPRPVSEEQKINREITQPPADNTDVPAPTDISGNYLQPNNPDTSTPGM